MKPLLSLLVTGMLFTLSATGQTPDYSQWLKTITVNGTDITVLRVPATQFSPRIQGFILEVQNDLKRLPDYYMMSPANSARRDLFKFIEQFCTNIEKEEPSFPVRYYREEVKAFVDLAEATKLKAEKEKKEKEFQQFLQTLKAGYSWINRDSIIVRSKPDTKSPAIGRIQRLSYVKAYEVDNKPDWAEVQFGDHSGYVLMEAIATDWDELEPTPEDSTTLFKKQFFFTPTAAYTAQLKRAAAEEERAMRAANAAPSRKYYRGPQGGCYFINSNKKREYVDHSFCK